MGMSRAGRAGTRLRKAWAWADPRPRKVGRRGLFLCFLVILDACYGYSLLTTSGPLAPPAADSQYPLISQYAWGIIWICAAGICASGIMAWQDRWQYSAAAALKMGWAARYMDLWFFHRVPLSWVAVVVWASFALTVMVVSGWPEEAPSAVTPRPPDIPEASVDN